MEEESGDGSSEVLKPELVVKSWTENMNISKLCRICANTSDNLISIFEGEGVEHELLLKINKHLPLKVSQEDRLPKNVCYPCTSTLIAWHDMTVSCIEADKRLHSLIQDTSETAVSDDEFCDDSQSMDLGDHDIDIVEDKAVVPTGLPGGTEELKIVEVSTVKKTATSPTKSNVKKDNNVSELPVVTEEEEVVSTVPESSVDVANVEACVASTSSATSTTNNEVTTEDNAVMETIEECLVSLKTVDDQNLINVTSPRENESELLEFMENHHNYDRNHENALKNPRYKKTSTNLTSLSNSDINNEHRFAMANNIFDAILKTERETVNDKTEEKMRNMCLPFKKISKYKCDSCHKVFKILSLYNKHMLDHRSNDNTNNKSAEEKYADNKIDGSKNCEKLSENLRSPYTCNECGRVYKSRDSLSAHLRTHSEEKQFICHKCGKQFSHPAGLSYHLKHVHLKIKNYSCDICGRSFAMKSYMEDHRRIHTGERPYVCDTCGKTFKTKSSLYTHGKSHTDKFPFPCHMCNHKFRWRQQLEGHFTIHTGEKKHVCDVCGKQFRVKNHMTCHKLIHNSDKPYSCKVCSLNFGQKRYLKRHMKTKHKCKYTDNPSDLIL